MTASAIDEDLHGVDLIDKSHADDEIYKIPIVIIPGKNRLLCQYLYVPCSYKIFYICN